VACVVLRVAAGSAERVLRWTRGVAAAVRPDAVRRVLRAAPLRGLVAELREAVTIGSTTLVP